MINVSEKHQPRRHALAERRGEVRQQERDRGTSTWAWAGTELDGSVLRTWRAERRKRASSLGVQRTRGQRPGTGTGGRQLGDGH